MSEIREFFEPRSEAGKEAQVIDALVLSIQIALQKVMQANRVSQKELAERLGVSPARISQILSSHSANLTLKTVGKIAYALGENFELVARSDFKRIRQHRSDQQFARLAKIARAPRRAPWQDVTANENRYPDMSRAA